ncbi:MAG: leucine-rich repeat protein, partial [Eggerthellaceae bacterium]|nr:leucine-rich repeat protein [Eggerthellaceae bacterium]
MEGSVKGCLRGALSAVMVCTLMVPQTAAFADTIAPASANGGDSVQNASCEANVDSNDSGSSGGVDDASGLDDGGLEFSTIIVELEDGAGEEAPSLFNLMGVLSDNSASSRHDRVKSQIQALADTAVAEAQEEASSDESEGEGDTGLSLMSVQEAVDENGGSMETVADYYTAIDGFAISAPSSIVDDIKNMDGVANAFVESVYDVPVSQEAETEATDANDSSLMNQPALDITGADDASYTGAGQLIAIIDTGIDTDHEAFSGDIADDTVRFTQSAAQQAASTLSSGSNGIYVSEKIVFAYDYADGDTDVNPSIDGLEHGTHVAGIAAANGGTTIRGNAPDAQLAIMKVASDSTGGISDSALLAAIDDAATLGADSVNISIGSDAGFSDEGSPTYANAINALEATGATVNVAAGNSYSSAYGNTSGSNLPYASDPDDSIVSNPATISGAFAVASEATAGVSVDVSESADASAGNTFVTSAGSEVLYYDALDPDGLARVTSFSSLAGGDCSVVYVGTGARQDFGEVDFEASGATLNGKVALIVGHQNPTGYSTVSYARAIAAVAERGAIGAIIYDPALEDCSAVRIGSADDNDWGDSYYADVPVDLPVAFVSSADGAALAAISASDRSISVSAAASSNDDASTIYPVNSWSSWGVTSDLKLKPEITAPGGNVYSSVLNNQYEYMSGTSMATPQIAGIAAQMHEYIDGDSKFAGMSDDEKADVVTQLLMSTATPMVDTSDQSSYYSPRHTGAGQVNTVAATTSDVYLTVEGAEDASRPKAELGESGTGSWSFTVTLHNLGSTEHTYTANAAALSEKVQDGLFQLSSANWTNSGISVTYGGDAYNNGTVTVPANGTASYTVTITCEEAFTTWAAENTPNGTFVDGYAMLEASDGGVDLSVPFLGFYGDWSDASVFDATDANSVHMYPNALCDAVTGRYLGQNPLKDGASNFATVDASKMVISDSAFYGANRGILTQTSLLRNADSVTYSLTGPNGEDDGSYALNYVSKTYCASWGYAFVEAVRSDYARFVPTAGEGAYTLTETAKTSGPTSEEQSAEFTVYYDTTAPTVDSVTYNADGDNGPEIDVQVTDATFIAGIDLFKNDVSDITPYSGFYRVYGDDAVSVVDNADGTHTYTFAVSIDDVKNSWGDVSTITNTVQLRAWDYGLNCSSAQTAVINPVAATKISLSSDAYSVAPGQSISASATLAPVDTTQTSLVWSSSDPSVCTVNSEGVITGVAAGEASIIVSVADNPSLTATASVTVADVSDEAGIALSAQTVNLVKGDTNASNVTALLSGNLAGKTVEWTLEGTDQVATVQVDASDSLQAAVSADYQVGDVTLVATVADGDKTYRATAIVRMRTSDYEDFIIDENHTLTGYVGTNSSIEIPNDVTAIADKAFYGNTAVADVMIPASVRSIGSYAFTLAVETSNGSWSRSGSSKNFTFEDTSEHASQLTTIGDHAFSEAGAKGDIVLPSSLTSLGEAAFENCTSLGNVTLPSSLTVVPAKAFRNSSIETVTMSDNVTSIGASAFSNCLFFSHIYLTDTAVGAATTGIPSHLQTIGDSAFAGTYLEDDIVLPASLKRLECSAFALDRFIQNLDLTEGLESIGTGAFNQLSITSMTFPDSLLTIDDGIFIDNTYLTEVTLGRNLADGDFANSFSWCPNVQRVNVPADALYYTGIDGVVFNKDATSLVYYPAGRTGSYEVPEGVETIESFAFEDTSLSSVTLPESLKYVESNAFADCNSGGMYYNVGGFDVLEFGDNIVEIEQNAFRQSFYADDSSNAGTTPNHLIVRGGNNGKYSDTKGSSGQTAYFGSGMTNLDFSLSGAPNTLVVAEDTARLNLGSADASAITVYAPAGSAGYETAKAALEAIGADPATQLKEYEGLTASLSITGVVDGGAVVSVQAESAGGVEGAVSYRFVQENADGSETVLQDWSSDDTIDWKVPADGTILRADVRDATYLVSSAAVGELEEPVFSTDLSALPVEIVQGGADVTLHVEAGSLSAASSNAPLVSYQWYEDGVAIAGANSSSYTVEAATVGSHEYYCVATASHDGLSATSKSTVATVDVLAQASAPVIQTDLPAAAAYAVGQGGLLSVAANSPDGGTLMYQWYEDGVAIDGACSSSYSVPASEEGTHEYSVVVTNVVGLLANAASIESSKCEVTISSSAATVTMNRLYNPNSGEHFYTASAEERDGLVALGWQYEGSGWVAPETSDTPVYRLYNPNGGDHHYTMSAEERDWLVSLG